MREPKRKESESEKQPKDSAGTSCHDVPASILTDSARHVMACAIDACARAPGRAPVFISFPAVT
jgi:hypothetical protein